MRRRLNALTTVAVVAATTTLVGAPAAATPTAHAAVPAAGTAVEARDLTLITDGLAVSVVDRATDTKVGSIGGFSTAAGIAVLADRHRAYVANSLGNSVAVLDTTTARITTTITGVTSPTQVLADPAGTHVYVATGSNLAVIDPATDAVTTVALEGMARGLAVAPDGVQVYASSGRNGRIQVVDTATGTVTADITGCASPTSLAVSPDGATLYAAADVVTGAAPRSLVSVVDPATRTVRTVLRGPATGGIVTGYNGLAMAPDGAHLYAADPVNSAVWVIDTATDTVQRSIPTGQDTSAVVATPDGGRLYVGTAAGGTVRVVDLATSKIITSYPGAMGGVGFARLVPAPPTAAVTAMLMPPGVSVSLSAATSTPGMADIISYTFALDDGRSWTQASPYSGPSYFATPGWHTVRVTVTDVFGGSDTTQVSVQVQRFRGYQWLMSAATLRYASAEESGTRPLIANRETGGSWETFVVYDQGDGLVSLLSDTNQRFLAVDPANGSVLAATSDSPFAAGAVFRLTAPAADGTVTLQSVLTGGYVSANDGTRPMTAATATADPAEHFYLVQHPSSMLRARVNTQFVTAEAAGAQPLIANRVMNGQWETFDTVDLGDGWVALFAQADRRFVTAEAAGTQPLIANRGSIGAWESFEYP